jgi:HD-GYP domain-containing protein (c-di-GMP phosphodiesterase class II)
MIRKVQASLDYFYSFHEFSITDIEIDSILPYHIYIKQEKNFVIIVEAGTLIDDIVYHALKAQKALYFSKKDIDKRKPGFQNLELYIEYAKDNPKYCIKLLYKTSELFFDKFFSSKKNEFNSENVISIIKSIVFLIEHNKNFVKENVSYLKDDNLIAHHSLQVCIYALNLGILLKMKHDDLIDLGIASYLHDVGMKIIGKDLMLKNSSLSVQELETMHKHCLYSVQIVMYNNIHGHNIIKGIKHHHENYDGTGYPDGLGQKDIGQFASIISISDVFDALTSQRPYRDKMSSYDALVYMLKSEDMKNKFNSTYIKVFIKLFASK